MPIDPKRDEGLNGLGGITVGGSTDWRSILKQKEPEDEKNKLKESKLKGVLESKPTGPEK